MEPKPQVTAILVAYNSAGVIAEAIRALEKSPEITEIIVVDNCSHDQSCALIKTNFPSVTLIENPGNEGFGRGNNIGLDRVTTEYALLVNPDAVLEENAISQLLQASHAYPDAAILAPTLYNSTGEIHQSFKRNVFNREKYNDAYIKPEGDTCAEFLSGALWLLNMNHMKNIGYFDPKIFLFYEDDDLCIRARKAGYGLVFVPQARAKHLMGASSGSPKPASDYFKQAHMFWSRLYLEHKYYGLPQAMRLAHRLRVEFFIKYCLYCAIFNASKSNRYRGRLRGINAFIASPGKAPIL